MVPCLAVTVTLSQNKYRQIRIYTIVMVITFPYSYYTLTNPSICQLSQSVDAIQSPRALVCTFSFTLEMETTSGESESSRDTEAFDALIVPQDRSVTVKFVTQDGNVFTQSYYEKITVGEIKTILVDVFAVPASTIELKMNDEALNNEKQLNDFDFGAYGILEFTLASGDPKYNISAENAYQDIAIPDVLTVKIDMEDGTQKDVVVEIEDRTINKPFLGGYLCRKSGIEYHHGYSQTGPPKPKVPPEMKSHRDTQTYWWRNRKLDTRYSQATQMPNEEIWIPTVNDKILQSGPYETADEREKRLDVPGKVRTIQRYFRAWKMRKALKELSREYKKRMSLEEEENAYKDRVDEERKKRELIGKVFPRTKGDFAMLYYMLEKWKRDELERISSLACGPSKIAEMYVLLEKEIEMLQSIEARKKQVREDKKIQKIEQFFKNIGDPLEWNSQYKNLLCRMDTLETQHGRDYQEIYTAVANRNLNSEDHMQTLLNVKLMLRDHNCEIANELIDLIDRACLLQTRGFSKKHLEALQMRIEALLLRHIQMPECSYGVTDRMTRVKERLMEENLFYCRRCQKLKTHDQFPLHSRTETFKVCLACSWDDRVMEPWVDSAPYRFILRWIRREERLKSSPSSIAFILQDKDIEHIITKIWHSHSAINECNDIYQLRLCRWFKDQNWAPWNCVLLTNEEVKAHLSVKKLEEVYDQEFLCHVYNKHCLAKKHFGAVMQLENYFGDIGEAETRWNEVMELKRFVAVNSKSKIFLSCH